VNELSNYVINLEEKGILRDPEFLTEVVMEYAKGCSIDYDKAKALAHEISNRFSEDYTLIARLAGTLIANKYECRVDDAERIIEESRGNAHYFILQYVNSLFKVHEKPNMANALIEAFALRRPFLDWVRPGDPILTPGIVEFIGEKEGAETLYSAEDKELRSWLAHRQHDLIEEAIGKLLDCIGDGGEDCEVLGDALKPWGPKAIRETLGKISENVFDEDDVVEYFASNYGEKLTSALNAFSDKCWKRAIYIIGRALAGDSIVFSFKDLSVFLPENLSKSVKSVVESLGDALKECGVDYYLLVGNVIPLLIQHLTRNHARALAGAFIDKYNETTAEIKRVLNIIKNKNRGDIYITNEVIYGLGLALIIAKAAELNKDVEPSDADAALHIASFALQSVASTDPIKPILVALVPLRDKAPQRYLEVLAFALGEIPAWSIGYTLYDRDTVMYIFNEFDYMLKKYRDGVKRPAWTLVYAMDALISFLYKSLEHCDDQWFEGMDASFRTELEDMVNRVASLLDEINRLNPSPGIIAWAHALRRALDNKCVRTLMESVLDIDVVNKAKEVAGELSRLRGSVQELIRDEGFMDFVEFWLAEVDEEAARREILEETSILKYTLAQYKLYNDELNEAERLFNEAAEESREINDYDYLYVRNLALRVEAIKGPLAGENLVKLINEFRQLYEETKKRLTPASPYYGTLSRDILGEYLVSLALTGDNEEIRRIEELLKEQWQGPAGYLLAPILTRLTLNALLSPRGELSGELKDKLVVVKPGELMAALRLGYIDINSLPALRATYGTIKRGDEKRLCDESIDDPIIHDLCMSYVSRVYSKELPQQEEGNLRQALIDSFQEWISKEEVLDLLKELGLDAGSLNGELRGLVNELSSRSLLAIASSSYCLKDQQLRCSWANLTYMLYALINGNEKLAKAHALYGAVSTTGNKLLTRLFLEAYRACCDPNNDGFKRAIAKLFFLHV